MGQIVGCLEGMSEACRALDFPIVSGNVSLYNETKAEDGTGSAILPTPAIGGVGLLEDWEKSATIGFKAEGETIFVIGPPNGHLGLSIWLRQCAGRTEGPAPAVDLKAERRSGDFVRHLIREGKVSSVHDVSDGGLIVALAEMALASGIGIQINGFPEDGRNWAEYYFGEQQGRYIVTVTETGDGLRAEAEARGIPCAYIGETGGDSIEIGDGSESTSLADLRAAHEGFFPALMGADAALA